MITTPITTGPVSMTTALIDLAISLVGVVIALYIAFRRK